MHKVLLVSPPPPSKYNEVHPDLFFSPLVFVVLFLVFGGVRVPGESLFVEGDDHLWTLDVGLFGRHQVRLVRVPPASTTKRFGCFYFPSTNGSDLIMRWGGGTDHFMRNMSSPVESVAPMIRSGSRPRAKPLSFSF